MYYIMYCILLPFIILKNIILKTFNINKINVLYNIVIIRFTKDVRLHWTPDVIFCLLVSSRRSVLCIPLPVRNALGNTRINVSLDNFDQIKLISYRILKVKVFHYWHILCIIFFVYSKYSLNHYFTWILNMKKLFNY